MILFRNQHREPHALKEDRRRRISSYQEEAMESAANFMNRGCKQQMQGYPKFDRKISSEDPAAEI